MIKNVFFIICDELRSDTLGFMGESLVKTPNLDSLAEDSVVFENCFCNTPMCVPSRVSIATGRYALSHGALDNGLAPCSDEYSLYEHLRQKGIKTRNYGKWHTNVEPEAFGFDVHYDGVKDLKAPECYINPFGIVDKDSRRGVAFTRNYGELPLVIYGNRPTHKDATRDSVVTEAFINGLEDIKASDGPSFTRLSLLDPHSPYFPSEPYNTMYQPSEVGMPENLTADLSEKPMLHRFFHKARGFDRLEEADYRKSKACYYGLISHVDDRIGQVISRLKALDLYDDSLIIFTSDHGSMMGEHGYIEKWGHMYDQVMHCPLVVKLPNSENKGRRVQSFTQLIDLMPTVLEYMGSDVPQNIHGKSLSKVLTGETEEHRSEVFGQIYTGGLQNEPALLIRDHQYKLTVYKGGDLIESKIMGDHPLKNSGFFDGDVIDGELYDLNKDPDEMRNLFEDETYQDIKDHYMSKLMTFYDNLDDRVQIPDEKDQKACSLFALMQGSNMSKVNGMMAGKKAINRYKRKTST